jgi:hypothetical protein
MGFTKLAARIGLLAVLVAACGGSRPSSGAPNAALPDEPPPPARNVPGASPLVKQGEAKLQAKDLQGARALFEQAAMEDPHDARAQLDLGITAELLADPKAAEAAYRKAVEIDGNLAEARSTTSALCCATAGRWMKRCRCCSARRQPTPARRRRRPTSGSRWKTRVISRAPRARIARPYS